MVRQRPSSPRGRAGFRLLAVAGAALCLAACAGVTLPPGPPRSAGAEAEAKRPPELIANSELAELRGGLRVNGLDLSFGMEIRTVAVGQFQLVSELTMNDAGKLVAVSSKATPLTNGAHAGTSAGQGAATPPSAPFFSVQGAGGERFQAVAGDSAALQAVHRLVDNSIATIVANRLNGVVVNQTTTMNVGVLNSNRFAARFAAIAQTNALARDLARLGPR